MCGSACDRVSQRALNPATSDPTLNRALAIAVCPQDLDASRAQTGLFIRTPFGMLALFLCSMAQVL